MINNLKRWAELDPKFCRVHQDTNEMVHVCPYGDVWLLAATVYADGSNMVWPEGLMAVQGAIQRSVRARGMYFELRYWPPRKKHKGEVDSCMGEWLDEPAEALLSAYVKALEVEME